MERYLREANHLPANTNDVLFFANKFIGKPYVAHTLEKGVEERLVVNLNQLDCTTYVEVVVALTLAARNGDTTFDRFLYYLQHLRYPNGVINGYASRYFISGNYVSAASSPENYDWQGVKVHASQELGFLQYKFIDPKGNEIIMTEEIDTK